MPIKATGPPKPPHRGFHDPAALLAHRLTEFLPPQLPTAPPPLPRPDPLHAALPEHRREEFDREINSAGVHEIHAVMRHWMFEAAPDPAADAIVDRLAREEAERNSAA